MADDRYTLSYTGEQVDELLGKIDNLGAATQSTDGLMSSEDKAKVDGIENGAQENVIESVTLNGVAQQVLNKTVNIVLGGATYMGIVYQDGGSSTPPTQKVFYLTGENGTYTNFNNIVVNDGEVAFLRWTGTTWVKDPIVTKDLIQDVSHTFYEDQTLDAGVSLKVGSWSNIKLSSTGGQTIAEYIASQIEVIKQFTYTVADSLPTASADTMYIIYLVPSANPQAQNARDEFITVRSGSEGSYTYAWEQIGSTEMDLSGFAEKDGNYEGMTVGLAENLVDKSGDGTEQEFGPMRPSGGDGIAVVKKMEGKSAVWNQLCDLTRFNRSSGATYDDVTAGEAGITATTSGDKGFTATSLVPPGHKVLLSMRGKPSESGIMMALFAGSWIGGSYASYVFTDTNWHNLTAVLTSISTGNIGFYLANATAGSSLQIEDCEVIDLTQMFGAGKEPTTVAEFRAMFPAMYYPYDAGSPLGVAPENVVSKGFNQWDEEWEFGALDTTGNPTESTTRWRSKNFCRIFADKEYHITAPYAMVIYFYDANYNFIYRINTGGQSTNFEFTPNAYPGAQYFKMYTYSAVGVGYANNICLNLSDATKNGTYEPYWQERRNLGLKAAKVNGIPFWNDGTLNGVGDVHDESTENEGTKRMGIVDLGTLTYTYDATVPRFYSLDIKSLIKAVAGSSVANTISNLYEATSFTNLYTNHPNKTMAVSDSGVISFVNTAYTNAADFKAAMSGVMLIYELATPVTAVYDEPLNWTYKADGSGTEEIDPLVDENGKPVTLPMKAEIKYGTNFVKEVESLPDNYVRRDALKQEPGEDTTLPLSQGAVEDNYAHKDGVYLELFAGMAQGIVDTRSAGTPQEFTRRKSGGDGVGYMTRIKGNSIVWNQLVDLSLGSHVHSTVAANGLLTITATVAASSNQFETFGSFPLIEGHKYLMRFQKVSGDATGTLAYFGPSAQSVADGGGDAIYTQGSSTSDSTFVIMLRNTTAESKTYNFTCYIQLFDLTASTLSVTSVSDFTKFYNLPYYAPNPGAILNNAATGMVTDGLNQWDEVWEEGDINASTGADVADTTRWRSSYIHLVAGQGYYYKAPASTVYARHFFYDANKNFISAYSTSTYLNNVISIPSGAAYMRFVIVKSAYGSAAYANNICINLSGSRNGEYEPHWSDSTALPITTATGKLNGEGESVVITPNGLAGVGAVYDEAIVEKGMWTKDIIRRARVNLGDLSFNYESSSQRFTASLSAYNVKNVSEWNSASILCSKYSVGTVSSDGSGGDKVVGVYGPRLYIRDTTYTDADTFMAAMDGVMLEYELRTEQLYVLDTPVPVAYQVDKDGTETVTTPEGTAPTSAPFKADTNYSISVGNLVRALAALQNA